jgi:two-component system cell cycle sensor histidine kinase/response regulator CckA
MDNDTLSSFPGMVDGMGRTIKNIYSISHRSKLFSVHSFPLFMRITCPLFLFELFSCASIHAFEPDTVITGYSDSVSHAAPVSLFYNYPYWFFGFCILGISLLAIGVYQIWMNHFRVKERALEMFRKNLCLLFENAYDGISLFEESTDPMKRRLLECNTRYAEMAGRTREELLNTKYVQTLSQSVSQYKPKLSGHDGSYRGLCSWIRPDGKENYIDYTALPIKIGGKTYTIGIDRDVTEQKRLEVEHHQARQMLEFVLNTVPQRVFWKDRDSCYLGCNWRFAKDSGLEDPQMIIGKTDDELGWKEVLQLHPDDDRVVMETNTPKLDFEERQTTADGSPRWLKMSKVPLHDQKGKVIGILGTYEDITQRKLVEEKNAEQAHLLDVALDSIIVRDVNEKMLFWNKSAEKLYGWTFEEVRNIDVSRLIAEDEQEKYKKYIQEYLQKGEWEGELHQRTKDGRSIITYSRWTMVRDRDGKPSARLIITRDITEYRQAVEELRYERNLFRTVIDNVPDPIYTKDTSCRKTLTNLADLHAMGAHSEDEVLGKDDFEIYPKELAERFFADDWTVIHTGQPIHNREENVPDQDGQNHWFLTSKMPMRDEKGRIIGLLGIGRDITEHKQAEEAVRYERMILRAVIDNVPDSIYTKDTASCKTLANLADVRNMGAKSEAEVLGKDDFAFYPKEQAEGFYADDQVVIRTGQPVLNREEYFFDENNQKHWLLTSKLPLRDEKGRITGLIGIGRDITVLKRTEFERENLINELQKRTKELQQEISERLRGEEERARLENELHQAKKMETIGHLAGGVAHDFNNLLSPILGYSEMVLRSMEENDPRYEKVRYVMLAAERARNLVYQLLAFSRKQVLELKVFDLRSIVTEFEKILRRTIQENIRLEVELPAVPTLIRADIGQIEQILMNLAVNAQDAMPSGGILLIRISIVHLDEYYAKSHPGFYAGQYICLVVSDTGIGMKQEILERIFEPFFTTKGVGKGTGLGLSTVYGIVKQHGGEIQVASLANAGSTFSIYLPAVVETVETPDTAEEVLTSTKTGTETIMLVEDDDMVLQMTKQMLLSHGFKVLTAENAEECIDIFNRGIEMIDLLLTDLVMPGMNGKELFEHLHLSGKVKKVLYMSGYTREVIFQKGGLDGEANFIQKPFTTQLLIKKVHEALNVE